jgi:hypothetical protein
MTDRKIEYVQILPEREEGQGSGLQQDIDGVHTRLDIVQEGAIPVPDNMFV